MSSTSYTTNCFSLRTIHTLRPVSADHYTRMRHLEDDYLDEPDEDEVPDDNIIYLTKEEQSTDD